MFAALADSADWYVPYWAALYWSIPAFIANMAPPVLAKLLPHWRRPISPWFGPNKTWRGLIGGTLIGGGIGGSIGLEWGGLSWGELSWHYSLLAACAALLGDIAGSFIKRRLHIPSGQPLLVLDQVDYLCGFLLVSIWFYPWSWAQIGFILLCGLLGNPVVNHLSYRCHLRVTKG